MTHNKLLQMIEAVDPQDTKTLDEIDARYYFWNNPQELEHYGSVEKYILGVQIANFGCSDGLKQIHKEYTRSRDALKKERPEGWSFQMFGNSNSGEPTKNKDLLYYAELSRDNPFVCRRSPELPTEELAELHAIIQAVAHNK